MLNDLRPLLLIAVAVTAAAPVCAQDQDGRAYVRSQREDAGARVRQVERDGGRVLQAEPMQRGGEEVYRLKVLTPEGRVRVLQQDPRRGGMDRSAAGGAPTTLGRDRERRSELRGQRGARPPERDNRDDEPGRR